MKKEDLPIPLGSAEDALDHFVEHVWPGLFKGRTNTKDYKRVYALVCDRRKQKAGRPHGVTDSRIVKILTRFGGEVQWNGRACERYAFISRVDCLLRETTMPATDEK